MFEHLDDPEGPLPSGPLRTAVLGRVRRRRQRRAAVVGGVAAVAVVGAGALVAARDRVTPEQVDVGGLATEPDGVGVLETDDLGPDDPMTYLLVGTDGAGPLVGTDGAGPDEAGYADTIVLARVEPGLGELRLLPVPRDLLVEWEGEHVRINTLLAAGGPSALVRVIDEQLGVPVHHYVQVDFAGAVELVDAVDGIRVAVDHPVRDERTGLALEEGCHALDGEEVLALGRSRFFEYRADGTWRVDPTSDLGRQRRVSVVAAALLQAVGRIGLSDLPAVVDAGLGAVITDDSLGAEDVVGLARRVRGYRLVTLALPVGEVIAPGGAVMVELAPGADDTVAALHGEAPSPEPGQDTMLPAYTLSPC